MAEAGWSHYEHEADIGIRAFGPTLEEALAQAALAMTGVITDPELVEPCESVQIEVAAPDPEYLLVEWLDALVFEMATRRMLFGSFRVALTKAGLEATVWGEGVDQRRHQPAVEVKGATLTDLKAQRTEDGLWCLQCVVDV